MIQSLTQKKKEKKKKKQKRKKKKIKSGKWEKEAELKEKKKWREDGVVGNLGRGAVREERVVVVVVVEWRVRKEDRVMAVIEMENVRDEIYFRRRR